MNNFCMWVSVLVKQHRNGLVNYLLEKGCVIRTMANNNTLEMPSKGPSTFYMISLYIAHNDSSKEDLLHNLQSYFVNNKISYLSLIVVDFAKPDATWVPGEIFVPEKQEYKSTGSPFRDLPQDKS